MSNIRTYQLSHFSNDKKIESVFSVLSEYRNSASSISSEQWKLFYDGKQLNKMADLFYIKSKLSERYKRNCAYQVDSSLKSFISNRQNEFVQKVYKSSLDDETQAAMLRINRRKLWYAKEHDLFTKEQLWLARKIFKMVMKWHNKPNFMKCNMLLNANVAEIIPSDKTKTVGFDYWIKFSTLEKGKPILIPIKSNEYFDKIEGKLCGATQFNFYGNEFTVSLMKDVPKQKYESKSKQITLDFGLKSLFTDKNGRMFGKNFFSVIKKYDNLISKLSANLQRQKVKLSTNKKYNKLVNNLKSFIKNEVNRVLNRIIKLYSPQQIIIENLNFKNSELSKQLNRILRNCGMSVINKKLESLKEIYGIDFKKINAAYSSQECSNCHYVDKRNRPKQEIFKCKFCKHGVHADVNAARTLEYRSSVPELANIYINRKNLLRKITNVFMKQNSCLNRKAQDLIDSNPYFKDFVSEFKQVA